MEVLRSNFRKSIPVISQAIKAATFLAIDGEFTGLSNLSRVENSLDTPEGRYCKLREGSRDFLLIQFGLCAFSWEAEEKKYIASSCLTCNISASEIVANRKFQFQCIYLPEKKKKHKYRSEERRAGKECRSRGSPDP